MGEARSVYRSYMTCITSPWNLLKIQIPRCHLRPTESESPGWGMATALNELLADSHAASLCLSSDLHLGTTAGDDISRAIPASKSHDSVHWTLGRSDLDKESSFMQRVLNTDWMATIGNITVTKKGESCTRVSH